MSATAVAAPFAITYSGTTANSTFPEIINGQPYSVTLVVDNGGSTAASQTWTGANLRRVCFTSNTAGNVVFTQDLAASFATLIIIGSMTTNAGGALTTNFTDIENSVTPPAGTFSFSGFTPVPEIFWFLDSLNEVFFDHDQFSPPTQRQWGDASGGVQMSIAHWTNPQPFSGSCGAGVGPTVSPTQIPTLQEWILWVLGLILLATGGLALRSRRNGP